MGESSPQNRSEIRELLSGADHHPSKHWGQNFLIDPNIVRKMVDAAVLNPSSQVVEIGAGTGTLTGVLAGIAHTVVAYEIDPSLESVLVAAVGSRPNVEIRMADASRVDLDVALDPGQWTMVSNLPYNVGTGIILDAVRCAPRIGRFVVMVQKEVADRLLAPPGNKTYGVPSVIAGLHVEGFVAFSVSPRVFDPPPSVDSAVVVLDRVDASSRAPRAIELASAAFGQRRKMIRRSLKSAMADAVATIESASLDPTSRAEDLSPADFVALAEAEAAR
ncbi:MAG: 16S rRNA (adenine(1518)-N(6)/adenine(1519)-N(6))-dimethyltransferase RsmA [Acidimicrobiia bacterium]